MGTPTPANVHWMVRLNYRNRSLSFMLMFGVLALHLTDHEPGVLLWALLALQFLVYPHVLYWLASRAENMLRAETRCMLADAGLFGCWTAVLGFPLWISFAMLISVHVNLTAFRGVRGLIQCLAVTLCGIALGLWLTDTQLEPDSNWQATLACMLALSLYLLMVSHSAFLRSASLRQAREKLRQSERQLHQRLAEINDLQIQLRELAHRDPLTGLYNRRHLDSELTRILADGQAVQTLSLLLIDIDHFKKINDEFGHQAGDQVLARLAGVLTSHCRQRDVICRYGGEEFVILMPDVSLAVAQQRAEQIRESFAEMEVRLERRYLPVTLSIGLAGCPIHGTTARALFSCADQALYQAKAAGRNRTVLWRPNEKTTRASGHDPAPPGESGQGV